MRLVLDTADLQLTFSTNAILLAELEEVLEYPRLAKPLAASSLTPLQLWERCQRNATVVQPDPIAPTMLADPDAR